MPGMSSLRDRHGRTIWFKGDPGPLAPKGGRSRKKKSKETKLGAEVRKEDLPLSSKTISRTQRDRKHAPKSIAPQSEGTSLQKNRETPTAPKKGKRRGRLAATGGPFKTSSWSWEGTLGSGSSGRLGGNTGWRREEGLVQDTVTASPALTTGRCRPQKSKADTRSREAGRTSAS